ncbi:hypothetical protein [Acidomonas methanolica]|uniref:Uncharacterized protein n=1 Tax=Acidomonas methanolica NBRC 104435 TaxID=1231351 RepID=A0A023D4L8_ACIMT|nr:hypothetical protein [Acidomonas methanolica]MBU2655589.1 hypothetical protein [Acidomonas methanolica]TCS21537.1 hypothetical protein EDC31_1363 [Acidomonas methanolica]GAJ29087.1 hypothetical protein Amme_046_016 [Acidomonas methanolica NBRC 104435]GBQ54485.1 hypothetical protein AA0498_2121 [Acidomonas methanolica]GEL00420.1 hypothetical protein AME01nite_29180 [Acidomonas methanolica NBRC 104435]
MDISTLLAAIPAQFTLYPALLIIACKIVTIFVRPPASTSRWAKIFALVNMLALNIGWATNRLQIDRTGIMVPREQAAAAHAALRSAGVEQDF